jgi:hypothetical protein
MNDLDLIAELRPESRLPGPAELASARGRLTGAIAFERADETAPELSPSGAQHSPRARGYGRRAWDHGRRPRSLRPAWPLALTAAAAVSVAAGSVALVAVPGHGAPTTAPRTGAHSSVRPGPPRPGALEAPATVNVVAARFLRQAAVVTRRQHASAPSPGQFVYTEIELANGHKSQAWVSADGRPGCTVAQAEKATEEQEKNPKVHTVFPCAGDEQAGYLPSMPTDPRALLAFLTRLGLAGPLPGASTSEQANDLGKAVDYLMQTTYLLPAQQAALFELMAQTPGFTVVHGARDAVGRVGVAVKWTFWGAPAEIILSPKTFAYLGDRTWPEPDFKGCKDCQNIRRNGYDGAALIKIGFVDRAGQVP